LSPVWLHHSSTTGPVTAESHASCCQGRTAILRESGRRLRAPKSPPYCRRPAAAFLLPDALQGGSTLASRRTCHFDAFPARERRKACLAAVSCNHLTIFDYFDPNQEIGYSRTQTMRIRHHPKHR